MKTRNKRNLIIMLVIVVLLIGAFVGVSILNKMAEEGEEGVAAVEIALTSFTKSEIAKITYQYEDEEALNYKYSKETWTNADDADFPLSSSAFANNFVEVFQAMTTASQVTEPEEDSVYGLDTPQLTLTVENIAGKKETFYLGDYNNVLGEYYLKIEGKEGVYTIGTDLLYICRKDMYDYADVGTFPSYSKSTLKYIAIDNGTTSISFTYKEDGSDADLLGQCKWFFNSPYSYEHSAETNKMDDLEEEVLGVLQFTKLANYKSTDADIEAYGLKDTKKKYTICDVVTDEDTEKETTRYRIVEFGNYDKDSDCYYARQATINGNLKEVSDDVYLVDKSLADSLLGIDPLDYVYKYVVYIKLIDLAREGANLVVTTPDDEYVIENHTTFKEDGSEDEYIYSLDGQNVETITDIEHFYYNILTSCATERLIYDKSTIVTDKEPTYTLTYNRNLTDEELETDFYGNQVVVTYTQYDTNYYQVSVNGYTDVLVNKRLMDENMASLAEINQ